MKKRWLLATIALGLASQLVLGQTKGRIAWVSYHPADDQPSDSAANAGATEAPDVGYTRLLRDNGYEVTRIVTSGDPDVDLLNTFDLVIISRSASSSHYQNGDRSAKWNGLQVPVINLNGYTLRSSRLGFTSGTTMRDTTMPIRLRALNPNHPIFEGISLDENGVTTEPYAGIVTWNETVQRGISFNMNPVADDGVIIAVCAEPDDPTYGGFAIAEWPAGAQMANGNHDVLGGRRMVFLTGSREQGVTSHMAGIYDLTPLGEQLFLNAVEYMINPPPVALIGLDVTGVSVVVTIATYSDVNLDLSTLQMQIDGQVVQPEVSNLYPTWTRLSYFLPKGQIFEPGSVHTLTGSIKDTEGNTYEITTQFQVPEFPVLPEEWALSSATDEGMNVNIYMTPVSRGGNSIMLAEWQLARGMIDPATGQPYENLIIPDTYEVDYVNWVQMRDTAAFPLDIDDTPEDGPDHFNSALPADSPIENDWIPGTVGFTEDEVNNIVAEVTCFLYLEPGYYRMGVNSDDGFLVTVAPGQPDIDGLRLGLFDSGRSPSDTLFDFGVTKAGFYPFRLLWFEGSGGASCEWFTVDLQTGKYLLINGPQPGAIKAYRNSAGNRAHVRRMLPPSGFPGLMAGDEILWEIEDGATTVSPSDVKVLLNGEEQTTGVSVSKSGSVTTVRFTLPEDVVAPNTTADVNVELQFTESNGETRSYPAQFTITGWVRPWLTATEEPEFAIGINFGADEPNGQNLGGLADTDVAGVVPQSHWNNTTGNTGTLANLVASAAGTAVTTSASVEWTCDNTWSSTGRGEENNGFSEGPDRTLMIGYLDTPTDGETRVTIRNIPAELTSSGYDLYIYALGGVSGRGGAYRVEDLDGNILVPTTTVVDQAGNEVQALPFILSSGNYGYFECPGLEDFSVAGNYVVFHGLTASDIVVVATTQGEWPNLDRAPINAIQLVKSSVPQPPSFSSIALTEDGKVVITWEGTATLQQADEVTGPWEDVPDATSPYTVTPTGKKKFFRLKR